MTILTIYGMHSVKEAILNKNRKIQHVFATDKTIKDAQSWIKQSNRNIPMQVIDKYQIDKSLPGAVHQGIAIQASPLPAKDLEQLTHPNILILDQLQDIRNIGAIIRTAASFGVKDLVYVKDHMPNLNDPILYGQLAKAASGAMEYINLVPVVNLSRAIDTLRKMNYWILGMDEKGKNMEQFSHLDKIALVIGQEGAGLRDLTKKKCDELIAIKTSDQFSCLNASIAAAVGMYALFGSK